MMNTPKSKIVVNPDVTYLFVICLCISLVYFCIACPFHLARGALRPHRAYGFSCVQLWKPQKTQTPQEGPPQGNRQGIMATLDSG